LEKFTKKISKIWGTIFNKLLKTVQGISYKNLFFDKFHGISSKFFTRNSPDLVIRISPEFVK